MGTALCIGIAAAFGVKRLAQKNRWAPMIALGLFVIESIALFPQRRGRCRIPTQACI